MAGVKGTGAPKEDMGSAEEVNAEMVVAGEAVVLGSEVAAKVAVAVAAVKPPDKVAQMFPSLSAASDRCRKA